MQSAYHEYHSIETALVKMHNDIMKVVDGCPCVILILLYLSAAFDTEDHESQFHYGSSLI